jgi:hypothetical protein
VLAFVDRAVGRDAVATREVDDDGTKAAATAMAAAEPPNELAPLALALGERPFERAVQQID